MTTNTDLYRAARDQLVDVIGDYDKAVEAFAWPQLTGAFNWATDWFDVIARGNERTALWIVEEGGERAQDQLRGDGRCAPTGLRRGWAGSASARVTGSS